MTAYDDISQNKSGVYISNAICYFQKDAIRCSATKLYSMNDRVNQFMHFNALPDTGHRDPGIYGTTNMRIYFDEADYQFAAIDWLLHPHRYLKSD